MLKAGWKCWMIKVTGVTSSDVFAKASVAPDPKLHKWICGYHEHPMLPRGLQHNDPL